MFKKTRDERRARGFTEVALVSTSVQPGTKRLAPFTENEETPPPLNHWRLNLSALSHVHNLFFLASADTIRVYEPEFPEQTIREPPAFIIKPPSSAPNLQGHIFQNEPHSINHLIVDLRGNDEILLIACDDGDAIAWRTDDIQNAVDRAAFCIPLSPRPIFLENVGASAWGLAIHKDARLIAVSCNRHTVTVFAPALVSQDPDFPDDFFDSADDEDRWADRRIELPPIETNIPSLAFCNTGEDPEGRWLLIGDIDGGLNLANVWAERMVEHHRCRFCAMGNTTGFANENECLCHLIDGESGGHINNITHGIWGVAFLDKRSFKRTIDTNETFGMDLSPQEQIYDISESRGNVRNNNLIWNPKRKGPSPQSQDSQHGPLMATWFQQPVFHPVLGPANHWMPQDPNILPMMRSFEKLKLKRIPRKKVNYHHLLPDVYHEPPTSPILQLTARDLFLLHAVHSHSALRPTIAFHDPLWQVIDSLIPPPPNTPTPANPNNDITISAFASESAEYDRLSLYAQIPELGVILIGSPKGRVGVFSLTQMSNEHQPNGIRRSSRGLFIPPSWGGVRNSQGGSSGGGSPGAGTGEPIFGFRMDHVLPSAEQECNGMRPQSQLVGLAVGPVQGMLGESRAGAGARRRRWRVVLTWVDGSVLCYELGKAAESEGMGLAGLIV